MQGFAIVRLEADLGAAKEGIVRQFNAYMQQAAQTPSFVEPSAGYFRIEYNDKTGIHSAAIAQFGNFLQSSGYSINGISGTSAIDGGVGTAFSFEKDGEEGRAVLSTIRVY